MTCARITVRLLLDAKQHVTTGPSHLTMGIAWCFSNNYPLGSIKHPAQNGNAGGGGAYYYNFTVHGLNFRPFSQIK